MLHRVWVLDCGDRNVEKTANKELLGGADHVARMGEMRFSCTISVGKRVEGIWRT
jgi:hypothetical protein